MIQGQFKVDYLGHLVVTFQVQNAPSLLRQVTAQH